MEYTFILLLFHSSLLKAHFDTEVISSLSPGLSCIGCDILWSCTVVVAFSYIVLIILVYRLSILFSAKAFGITRSHSVKCLLKVQNEFLSVGVLQSLLASLVVESLFHFLEYFYLPCCMIYVGCSVDW